MRRVRQSRIRLIGVVAMVLGALIMGGIGGGWWWTNHHARQTSHRLVSEAERSWAAGPDDRRRSAPGSQTMAGIQGSVIAVVRAPRLGAQWRMPVQRGTGTQVLREGLGLYAGSPLPGVRGNVALAGHRTTWGAPLEHLDRFRPGDEIIVGTASGTYVYRVIATGVTEPSDVSVIEPAVAARRAMLTLTTCHPEFSARQRLYVHAVLIDGAKKS